MVSIPFKYLLILDQFYFAEQFILNIRIKFIFIIRTLY